MKCKSAKARQPAPASRQLGVNLMKCSRWIMSFCGAAIILLGPATGPAFSEPGLLLVAHGAPMPAWNKPVIEFGAKVAERVKADGRFGAVRTAMLEFTEPTIPVMLAELEAEGCDRIVVVPLFVAPSGHTTYDLPTVLGLYTSPDMRALLEEEGAEIAQPSVPVIITQTLSGGDLLARYAVDQVRKLSEDPKGEALVLIAHGDEGHHAIVESAAKRVATFCCGQTGIDYADWAFVEMGQSFVHDGGGAIARALEEKERVLVVGLYVSSTAKSIAGRALSGKKAHGPMGMSTENPFDPERLALSGEGIIAHPATADWVIETAMDALK